MKKTLFTALVICASIFAASAQTKTDVAATPTVAKETEQKSADAKVKQAQEWRNKLVTELKLSEEQVQKIDEMNKAFDERRKGMEANTTYTEEFKAERRVVLKKAQEAAILKLLTPEQQARYKELVDAKGQ